jgi:hypothetical protein
MSAELSGRPAVALMKVWMPKSVSVNLGSDAKVWIIPGVKVRVRRVEGEMSVAATSPAPSLASAEK